MEQKLIVSASPHLRSGTSTQKIMLDVIIALAPAAVASVILFGPRALLLMAVSVASCVVCEYICRRVLKRPQTVNDLSARCDGPSARLQPAAGDQPRWWPCLALWVAIVVVKQMFGGIGQNFVNPALTARIILMTSFPTRMTTWTAPFAYMNGEADAMTTATPLALSAQGATDSLPGLLQMFLGVRGGCLGETCALALLLGGIYLVARRVISPVIPVCYLGTGGCVLAAARAQRSVWTSWRAACCWAPSSWPPTTPPARSP